MADTEDLEQKKSLIPLPAASTMGRMGLSIYQFFAGALLASGISWFIGFALSLAFGIIIGPIVGFSLILIVSFIYVALTWRADTYRTEKGAELTQQVAEAKAEYERINLEADELEKKINQDEEKLDSENLSPAAQLAWKRLQNLRKKPVVENQPLILEIPKSQGLAATLWDRFLMWWYRFYEERLDEVIATIKGIATAMSLLWPAAVYLATLTAKVLGAHTSSAMIAFGSLLFTGNGALVALVFLLVMSFILAWSAKRDAILTRQYEKLTASLMDDLRVYQSAYRKKENEERNWQECQVLIKICQSSKPEVGDARESFDSLLRDAAASSDALLSTSSSSSLQAGGIAGTQAKKHFPFSRLSE